MENYCNVQKTIIIFKYYIILYFRHGITVLGISSDGDWRPLNSMRAKTNFDINPLLETAYGLLSNEEVCYVQDTTHIGTKLRNRMLKASILLPFGNKIISVSHLKILLDKVPKDKHGLVYKDVSPEDRQNYGSLEKVMSKPVLDALKQHVFDSEATIAFLNICRDITSSYLDLKLKPTQRVYRIWHALFVLRIWRNWILSSTRFNLSDNFISENAYNCGELNALGLLHLIIKLRDIGKPEWFLTHLFDSQPCEHTFRTMRSMGTINYTKINFTLIELLHLVERVELQNDIIHNRLANLDIKFPRVEVKENHECLHDLPSNEELIRTLKLAQEDAKKLALEFDMHPDDFDVDRCPMKKPNIAMPVALPREFSDSETESEFFCLDGTSSLNLHEYNKDNLSLTENSKYVEVCYPDNSTQIVRKSSIVWLLSDSTEKLSSDRLKRVQTSVQSTELQHPSKRSKLIHANTLQCDQLMHKCEELTIGEWCIFTADFDNDFSIDMVQENTIQNIIIGTVLAFQYSDGRTDK